MLKNLFTIFFLLSFLTCFNSYAGEKERVHNECLDLGFEVDTPEIAKCKLELLILSRKSNLEEKQLQSAEAQVRAAEAQAKAAEANARANQSIADIERSRDSQKMINQGLKSLSGQCNLILGNC